MSSNYTKPTKKIGRNYNERCGQVNPVLRMQTDIEQLSNDIQILKEYIKQLEHTPKEPPRFSDRTEKLAQPALKILKSTYDNFKNTLPKFKANMLKEDLLRLDTHNITTEQFKDYIERRTEIEKERIRAHRKRFIEFEKTLSLIEEQCRESVMNDIVKKFASYVANRTIKNDYPKVLNEPHQHLCHGLVCNMLMSLGINNNDSYKSVDISLFEGLANVLADIILKTLIKIQIIDPEKYKLPTEVPEIKCTQIDCISKRARRAANKNYKKMEEEIDDKLNKLKPSQSTDNNDSQFQQFVKSTQCQQHVWQYEIAAETDI